jgi:hypothetical protein
VGGDVPEPHRQHHYGRGTPGHRGCPQPPHPCRRRLRQLPPGTAVPASPRHGAPRHRHLLCQAGYRHRHLEAGQRVLRRVRPRLLPLHSAHRRGRPPGFHAAHGAEVGRPRRRCHRPRHHGAAKATVRLVARRGGQRRRLRHAQDGPISGGMRVRTRPTSFSTTTTSTTSPWRSAWPMRGWLWFRCKGSRPLWDA